MSILHLVKPDRQAELDALPQSYDIHWTTARKAEVARAVRDRLITFDEARWRYLVSKREFEEWKAALRRQEALVH